MRRCFFLNSFSSACLDRGKMWPVAVHFFTLQWWWEASKAVFELWVEDGCKTARKSSLPFPACAELELANATCWGWRTLFQTPLCTQAGLGAAHRWTCLSSCSCPIYNSKHLFQVGRRCFYIHSGDCSVFQLGGLSSRWVVFANMAFWYWYCNTNGRLSQ